MRWSCGLTTVPERYASLQKTAVSLAKAGFDDVLVGVDGCVEPRAYSGFPAVTCRRLRGGNFANWYLTACEVYLRDPFADAYAMFEDDLVLALGTRDYLEATMKPGGYYNLFTSTSEPAPTCGWFKTQQRGLGALALAFRRDEFVQLLRSPDTIFHANDTTPTRGGTIRGQWLVDAVVVTVLNRHGALEYCHSPSIAQHTGMASTLGNPAGIRARKFAGEDFDMRSLLK